MIAGGAASACGTTVPSLWTVPLRRGCVCARDPGTEGHRRPCVVLAWECWQLQTRCVKGLLTSQVVERWLSFSCQWGGWCFWIFFFPPPASRTARSLGSVALRKAETIEGGVHFNVFTVDFNEELVALYGGSLLRQTHFLHESIKAILRLYKVRPPMSSTHQAEAVVMQPWAGEQLHSRGYISYHIKSNHIKEGLYYVHIGKMCVIPAPIVQR